MKRRTLAALALFCALSAPGLATASRIPASIAKAVADPSRPKADRDADALRKPAETLAFSGVKPGMVVAELFPGGGYYTRMLADVVGPRGRVIGTENAGWKGAVKSDQQVLASLNRPNVTITAKPFGELDLPQPIDLFWITQNYHDLQVDEFGKVDMAAFNRRVFAALKPGGSYMIIDHQANPGITHDQIGRLHRIEKATVIREVTAAGFKLEGEGPFLARGTDDHTLPIFDKAVQGKTDQYALKFVKR